MAGEEGTKAVRTVGSGEIMRGSNEKTHALRDTVNRGKRAVLFSLLIGLIDLGGKRAFPGTDSRLTTTRLVNRC